MGSVEGPVCENTVCSDSRLGAGQSTFVILVFITLVFVILVLHQPGFKADGQQISQSWDA